MKKIVSLILALVMVFALATTASAITERVVGNDGSDPSYNDGWIADDPLWNNVGAAKNTVEIKVTAGSYESRYAVDVEYEAIELEITSATLTWDVNELEYVAKIGTGTLEKPADKTITVKNYSDQPVYVTADVTDSYTDDNMEITVDYESEIAAVVAGATDANKIIITVSFDTPYNTADEWADVASYYANVLGSEASKQIATVDILISKTAP